MTRDLAETNDIGETPLDFSIGRRLLETTKLLCESVDLHKAQAAIRCLGLRRGNYVHYAIRQDARIALYLANKADEATLREQDIIMACLYELGRGASQVPQLTPEYDLDLTDFSERHINFNLSGLEHPAIKEAYLDRLSRHLRFESVLKQVVLPQITVESSADPGQERSRSQPPSAFTPYVHPGDKQPFHVVALTLQSYSAGYGDKGSEGSSRSFPSHSDASIEEALQGFDVEIWDWKRMAAQQLERVKLFVEEVGGTGEFPARELIQANNSQGLEDHDLLMAYLEFFKKAIEEQTNNQVKVYYGVDKLDIRYPFEMKSIEGDVQALVASIRSAVDACLWPTHLLGGSEIPWYDCMANFSSLLRKTPSPQMTGRVKIAIIDDGIDAMWDGFDGKIASGEMFAKSMTDLVNPYYTSSSNHGIYMAMLICKICPEVSLYIAKVGGERGATDHCHISCTNKNSALIGLKPKSNYDT
ncbi:hypothetical protein J3459_003895 [Metarhizium acridum]|nr:hypothetical protein J3459_003895 [Metarhizium acridum]